MMKPQIEAALRGVTQGTGTAGVPRPPPAPAREAVPRATETGASIGTVRIVSNTQQLDQYLAHASQTRKAVVIFFTSATCPPCKMVYAPYDELAAEAGEQAVLIKVDVSTALDVGMRYGVRATPTFMTFLDGGAEKVDEWSGANAGQLRGNVRLLVQMQAGRTQHPHRRLDLPTLQRDITSYVLYKKVPPLDKVRQKLGSDPADEAVISSIITFLQARNNTSSSANVPIPETLPAIGTYLQTAAQRLPRPNHFAVVDLARLLFLDPRVSGYFAERDTGHQTLFSLFSLASEAPPPPLPPPHPQIDSAEPKPGPGPEPGPPPYNLRMLLLHLACNLFSNPLYTTTHLRSARSLRDAVLHLATSSLLDYSSSPATLRVAAASCLYNFAVLNHNVRLAAAAVDGEEEEPLTEEEQVEMAAAMIEALRAETESVETVRGLVVGLGLLVYGAVTDGAVVDVCRAMGVTDVLGDKRKEKSFGSVEEVIREVGRLFDIESVSL